MIESQRLRHEALHGFPENERCGGCGRHDSQCTCDLFAEVVKIEHQPSEFFKAFYWMFEGRFVRLTTYNERHDDEAALTKIAFDRARVYGLVPIYKRVFVGQFLRHGEDWALPVNAHV
jgi:hypothetical protein